MGSTTDAVAQVLLPQHITNTNNNNNSEEKCTSNTKKIYIKKTTNELPTPQQSIPAIVNSTKRGKTVLIY